MRRRLTFSILAVAILSVALFAVPLGIAIRRFVDEQASLRLERQAVLSSRQVPSDFATNEDPVELPSHDEITLGLYDQRGHRVAGQGPSRADALATSALHNQIRQTTTGGSRVVAIPIVDRETVVGALRASQPTGVSDRRANRAIMLLTVLAVVVLTIGAVVARYVAGRLVRPIKGLRDQAVRLGDGDFAISSTPSGVPELDDASEALVTTAARLDDLVHRERAFSADASHQLRTPLAALRANIETEIRFPRAEPTVVLTEALEDITRLEDTIEQLLTFARGSAIRAGTTNLTTVLDGVQARWNGTLADLGRRLTVLWPPEQLVVTGSGALLGQAFDTLMDNAVTHGGGEVLIDTRVTDESVTVAVTDHGPGFLPREQDDPDAPGHEQGTHGFGLALAERLAVACQGRLVIASTGPHPTIEIVLRRASATDQDR